METRTVAGEVTGRAPEEARAWYARHIPALDGVRGVAILMVVVSHFVFDDMKIREGTLGAVLHQVESFGRLGVDLFFVLSGFLITGILLDQKGSQGYFRTFYARRTLRIFPLYYLTLVIVMTVVPLLSVGEAMPLTYQIWAWLYLTNVATTFWGVAFPHLNHLWSLAVEEHFYLIWPLVVAACGRRSLAWVCAGLVVLALAIRVWLTASGYPSYFLSPARFDALATGALLALAVRTPAAAQVRGWVTRWWALAGVLASVAVSYLVLKMSGLHLWSDSVRYTGCAALFGVVVAMAAIPAGRDRVHGLVKWVCELRALRVLGKYSYGLYVYHAVLLGLMDHYLASSLFEPYVGSAWAAVGVKVACQTAVSMAVAVASWHLFEAPILSLKRYFEYKRDT